MTIRIEGLAFDAILGILEHERKEPQKIVVDAILTYSYHAGGFLDYADIARTIRTVMIKEKFLLVEEALEHLFALLKETHPQISSIKIAICKPDILPDCRVCVEDSRSFL